LPQECRWYRVDGVRETVQRIADILVCITCALRGMRMVSRSSFPDFSVPLRHPFVLYMVISYAIRRMERPDILDLSVRSGTSRPTLYIDILFGHCSLPTLYRTCVQFRFFRLNKHKVHYKLWWYQKWPGPATPDSILDLSPKIWGPFSTVVSRVSS
jgi:hypothetical protein